MEFGMNFFDDADDRDIFLDNIPFQIEDEHKSKRRKEDDTNSSPTLQGDATSMSFPEKVLGQQIKQKTQTNVVSKKTSVYISAVMEGIAKFVLGKAGEEKDHYILPENRCIRVDDVEKVLSTVGVPELESDLVSREYLCGKTICIDSINDTVLEQTQSTLSSIIKEYIDVSILSINPSPLLQDYIVQQLQTPDGLLLTTYCERVQTALQFQSKTKQCLLIPRSLRLLLSACVAHGKQRQQGLLFLKNYLNSFHDNTEFTADIYIDVDDNTKYYKDYNQYRRDMVSNHDCQKPSLQYHKLEIEQLVFYKIIRDIMKGKWIITIPRYCHPESWEYEQMLRIAAGRVETFQKCSIQLEFDIKSLNTRGKIIYTDAASIMKKFNSLKKFHYTSLWNDEVCEEKNQTVLCNVGLLCLCPMEVIPVIYHHLYYQSHIVLFSSLSENHPSIRSILELIRGGII